MSKLLKRAKVQMHLANECYTHFADDDSFIDGCCYCVQQVIELTLKYIVEMQGESYAENHDLRSNLNILDRIGFNIPCKSLIRQMASTLYSWQTESRYKDNFVALKVDIDDAMKVAAELLLLADSLTSQENVSESASYPNEHLNNQ